MILKNLVESEALRCIKTCHQAGLKANSDLHPERSIQLDKANNCVMLLFTHSLLHTILDDISECFLCFCKRLQSQFVNYVQEYKRFISSSNGTVLCSAVHSV